jgi:hypothetical protein
LLKQDFWIVATCWVIDSRRFEGMKLREEITQPPSAVTQETCFLNSHQVETSNHCFHVVKESISACFIYLISSVSLMEYYLFYMEE